MVKDIEKLDNGGTGRPALCTKTEKDCEDGFDNECEKKLKRESFCSSILVYRHSSNNFILLFNF